MQNSIGESAQKRIHVEGNPNADRAPGRPTDLKQTETTSTTIKFEWKAPEDQGDSLVEKYNIVFSGDSCSEVN